MRWTMGLWMIAAGVLAVGEIVHARLLPRPDRRGRGRGRAVVALAGGGARAPVDRLHRGLAAASLLVLRPIARRHLRTPAQLRTGTAALVGARAVVLERVDGDGGQVKIGGEVWSARSYDEDECSSPARGSRCMKIDGATALVAE